MSAFNPNQPRSGFTLVELLTVMMILGVLVALVIGAAHGILQNAARTETEQTIRAIAAGLSAYYDDWHAFPWYTSGNQWPGCGSFHPLMEKVAEEYRPLDAGDTSRGDPAAACLYLSLTMQERHGPYYTGSGGNVETLAFEDENQYRVFVDGWGRPIHYFQPPPDPDAPTEDRTRAEYYMPTPLLMSEGPEKDMPAVAETKVDNIYNYPVKNPPGNSLYLQ